MKKNLIIAFAVICSILLVIANIVCILTIIASTCAPWEKVIVIFLVVVCINTMGLHYLKFLYDSY